METNCIIHWIVAYSSSCQLIVLCFSHFKQLGAEMAVINPLNPKIKI